MLQKCCRVAAELLPVCLLQSLQLAACLTRPQVDTSSQRRPRSPTPAFCSLLLMLAFYWLVAAALLLFGYCMSTLFRQGQRGRVAAGSGR